MSIPLFDLLGYWQFNEGAELFTEDTSPGGHNGLLSNSNMWTIGGKNGYGLELGPNRYVSLGSASNLLGIQDEFSFFYFIRVNSFEGIAYVADLGYRGGSGNTFNRGLNFYVIQGEVCFRVRQNYDGGYPTGRAVWSTGVFIKPGEFNLVICKRNNTHAYVKVINSDGIFTAELDLEGSFPLGFWDNREYMFGALSGGGNDEDRSFSTEGAVIDECAIYGHVTSNSEDLQFFNEFQTLIIQGQVIENLAVDHWNIRATLMADGSLSDQQLIENGPFILNIPGGKPGPHLVTVCAEMGSIWTSETSFIVGDKCFPSDPSTTPYYYRCIVAGTSGETEPIWPTSPAGATLVDGDVQWELVERMVQPITHGPLIPTAI